jgi:hypothetical protein
MDRSREIEYMNQRPAPAFIRGGHVISDMALMCHSFPDNIDDEDANFTRIFFLFEELGKMAWNRQDWPDVTTVSTCDFNGGPGGRPASVALSNHGVVRIGNSIDTVIEQIPGAGMLQDKGDNMVGTVSCIRHIDGCLYVCGMTGQVYRRDDKGWQSIAGKIGKYAYGLHKEEKAIHLSGNPHLEIARMV